MSNLRRIPRGLEKPVPIFFMDPVEFVVALMFLGIGIIAKQVIVGLGGMMFVIALSRKLNKGAKRGAAKHVMWSRGLVFVDPAFKEYGCKPTEVYFTE